MSILDRDGGQAFPGESKYVSGGMTLLQYYQAIILSGSLRRIDEIYEASAREKASKVKIAVSVARELALAMIESDREHFKDAK